ncbi:MAG: 23S rRNA (adenine(2503)-C(2))-methyltransferase RlmN [Chloroflexota bacterium]
MSIYDLDLASLEELVSSWDAPAYRAKQIWEGVYQHLYASWDAFTNLPASLRARLASEFSLAPLEPVARLRSSDGQTQKTAFRLEDGQQIETVAMRYARRVTLCVSSQAGCAMGCVFCATGQMGFRRHLSSGEIVAQVLHFARELKIEKRKLTNIVVMGMGEPFHNYDQTMQAIDRLNDRAGFSFGARRFTISTVGLPDMIRRFADEKRQINLAISLHAADDKTRSRMLPVNRKYNIDNVLEACKYYVAQTGRRVTFEWALIDGVNDSVEQARALTARLRGLLCHVNAIPLNPTTGYSGKATSRERALLFRNELERGGIRCTVRLRRGIDIAAGCGQLGVKVG